MKKRFSGEQIISILREAEAGVSARELCRKHAISDATFYTWRKKYGGMKVPEVKRLRKRTPDILVINWQQSSQLNTFKRTTRHCCLELIFFNSYSRVLLITVSQSVDK